jgi:DeoR family fructose operon transcriptional repressor
MIYGDLHHYPSRLAHEEDKMSVLGEDRRLLALERRIELAEILTQNPVVTVEELAGRFNVSAQTVRRDFQYLQEHGLITRTHGGAVARHKDLLSPESMFPSRELERAPQKRAIARLALDLVQPCSTTIMDASTTVLYLARALPRDIELSVIVNALPIAMDLSARQRVTVTTVGGAVRPTSMSSTGPLAETAMRRMFADCAFISARGLSPELGLTEANPSESSLKEIMVTNSARVIALVDSSKLGRTAFSLFAPISAIDTLITDTQADAYLVDRLRASGVEVLIAPIGDRQG